MPFRKFVLAAALTYFVYLEKNSPVLRIPRSLRADNSAVQEFYVITFNTAAVTVSAGMLFRQRKSIGHSRRKHGAQATFAFNN